MSFYADDTVTVHHGDCLDVLATLPDASVDAVVTDPPYGLEFMGKEWDRLWDPRGMQPGDAANRGQTASPYRGSNAPNYGRDSRAMQDWHYAWAVECLRVLKPGGHLLAFGGTRTSHRLACAIEDAGFEIRDSIAWLYGSGFPKSLAVDKAIDKARGDGHRVGAVCRWLNTQRQAAGVTHDQVRVALDLSSPGSIVSILSDNPKSHPRCPTLDQWENLRALIGFDDEMDDEVNAINSRKGTLGEAWESRDVTGEAGAMWDRWEIGSKGHSTSPQGRTGERRDAPASDAARTWQGWGTALKPAHEPVVVARKPLAGTVAGNVLAHGTGALNIDGCRVGSGGGTSSTGEPNRLNTVYGEGMGGLPIVPIAAGRWPANVVLDESQAAALDQQSGETKHLPAGGYGTQKVDSRPQGSTNIGPRGDGDTVFGYGDTGGASRYFYTAKADAAERVRLPKAGGGAAGSIANQRCSTCGKPRISGTRCECPEPVWIKDTETGHIAHPTVKPLTLMRWLVRLVTPPGGLVLEPFAGSGTTVEACILEGFRCVAIEREADYLPLIVQRIHRRRDPVAAVLATAEDGGLFDLLDEEEPA